MDKRYENLPASLKESFRKIDEDFLAKSRERLDKESEKNDKTLDSLNHDSFELRKDLMLLAGTVFGSSIALASGKTVNSIFVTGEIFLLLSIIVALISLNIYLKGKEFEYALFSKYSLSSYLLMNKSKIEEFEVTQTEKLIKSYDGIINSNQKGLVYLLAKCINIEKWSTIFNTFFILGTLLILLSISPWTKQIESTTISLFKSLYWGHSVII